MMAYFHVSTRKISDKISSGDTSGPVSVLWSEQAAFHRWYCGFDTADS
jgi:hypothetical protein